MMDFVSKMLDFVSKMKEFVFLMKEFGVNLTALIEGSLLTQKQHAGEK